MRIEGDLHFTYLDNFLCDFYFIICAAGLELPWIAIPAYNGIADISLVKRVLNCIRQTLYTLSEIVVRKLIFEILSVF